MAVFEGARPRPLVLPRPLALPRKPRAIDAPALPRRRTRAVVRARRRPTRLSIVLGAVVVAFVAAFFSLSQDVRVSASGYDVDRLATQHARLQAQQDELVSQLNRLGRVPAIRKQAIGAGLGPLPEPIVIAAR